MNSVGIALLVGLCLLEPPEILSAAPRLLPWIAVMAFANLLPVSGWYSASLAPDLPIAVAAALILNPVEVGVVAFLGAFDPKELRRDIPARKAIYNRVQVSGADLIGSLVGHAILSRPSVSPLSLPVALVVLATIVIVNVAFVGPMIAIEQRIPLREVVRRVHPGAPIDLTLTFLSWAVLGAMVVALYIEIHSWALLAFMAPVLLGRQVLARSQMFLEAVRAFQSKERALTEISRTIQQERTDERRLIAADLHDEVLQPLFKVSLMAHVIKADLAGGRLLEVDDDLPELLSAAEIASETLRDLIGDLRRSTLGRGGLDRALSSLIRALQAQASAHLRTKIHSVKTTPEAELVIYQIAKEALTNAVSHSRARVITVSLEATPGEIVLSVVDDGVGFDPSRPMEGHYGLHIMRERAASIGGALYLDSMLGAGSTLRLIVR
jgi:signal transduction histidine kinase